MTNNIWDAWEECPHQKLKSACSDCEIKELREALRYFTDRVEAGTIRSKVTYAKYIKILDGK